MTDFLADNVARIHIRVKLMPHQGSWNWCGGNIGGSDGEAVRKMKKMKVFLSWSGRRSRRVAEALWQWLPTVADAFDPWMSAEDIDRGARWAQSLATQLEDTRFGIVCLTRENVEAPWIMFESGALSKTLSASHVCPYLLGIEISDVPSPLGQFMAARAEKEDTWRLLQTLNGVLGEAVIPEVRLADRFETYWPRLSASLNDCIESDASPKHQRSDRDLLTEILETVRGLSRTQAIAVGLRPSDLSEEDRQQLSAEVERLSRFEMPDARLHPSRFPYPAK
jgi:hypothetical protein